MSPTPILPPDNISHTNAPATITNITTNNEQQPVSTYEFSPQVLVCSDVTAMNLSFRESPKTGNHGRTFQVERNNDLNYDLN